MCFLNFVAIRSRRKSFIKSLLKKIQKKKHQLRTKRKSPSPSPPRRQRRRVVTRVYTDSTETSYYISGFLCIAGVSVSKLPPPPATITWTWNTNKEEDVRNWVELPPEVTLRIFTKLETVDILLTAAQVCSSWRRLSREPILYRSVVISGYDLVFRGRWLIGFLKIVREAVDRSCGKLVQFTCGNMCRFRSIHQLRDVIGSSNSLISLRLGHCYYIDVKEIVEVVKDIPTLEELYLHCDYFPKDMIHNIGFSCQKLKHLQIGVSESADVEAFEIANNMPHLRGLRLLGNGLTNKGLQAILDGCSHLEYMYLKGFSNLEGDLLKKHYGRIKSITVKNRAEEFGEECEFHLEANSCRGLSCAVEENGDYGGLSLCKSSFNDYVEPYFTLNA